MNNKSLEQARNLVKASYISQGEQALNGRRKQVGYTMCIEDVVMLGAWKDCCWCNLESQGCVCGSLSLSAE